MAIFFGALGSTGTLARVLGRRPEELGALDLLALVAAGFAALTEKANELERA